MDSAGSRGSHTSLLRSSLVLYSRTLPSASVTQWRCACFVHIPRQHEAASYDEGNYFISHFRISPRGLIHIHARAWALRLRNAPVVVPVSLRFKHGFLILGLTPSLIPLSSLILSLNENKYYLQYGMPGLRGVGIIRVLRNHVTT